MGVVTLDNDLGIERCAALKEALAAHAGESPREVDGAAVERVHTAALQLLAAWWRQRDAAGLVTGWSACSDTLRAAAVTLGLDNALGIGPAPGQQRNTVEHT